MISVLEKRLASFVRRFMPGYDYIAILYKLIVYIFLARNSSQTLVSKNYKIADVNSSLVGATFFGYYDRHIENKSGDFILINIKDKVAFLHVYSAELQLLFDQKLPIWNLQQGVLATWVNDNEFIYNTVYRDNVVACRHNLRNNTNIYLPYPLQSLSLVTKRMCSIDLAVLRKTRPEYSYTMCDISALSTNKKELLITDLNGNKEISISYSYLKKLAFEDTKINNFKLNHCIFSPSGRFVIFLARGWHLNNKVHALMCLDCNMGIVKPILQGELVSHYNWLSDDRIVYWGTKDEIASYHIIEMTSLEVLSVNTLRGDFREDGHPAPISYTEFITDTYPDRLRRSKLKRIIIKKDYSSNVETIATLRQPFKYFGPRRVDLHPRTSDGTNIYIDSGHSGVRRLYKISEVL